MVEIQTDFNTIDVRGERAKEALLQVAQGLISVPDDSAVFIVHGIGTGKLRSEIHRFLQRQEEVAKYSLEPSSNGGCTIVHRK